MHAKLLSLSLITGLMSATAFAEPAIQAGDSLESLSKVKVSTTVNGQAGSIQLFYLLPLPYQSVLLSLQLILLLPIQASIH